MREAFAARAAGEGAHQLEHRRLVERLEGDRSRAGRLEHGGEGLGNLALGRARAAGRRRPGPAPDPPPAPPEGTRRRRRTASRRRPEYRSCRTTNARPGAPPRTGAGAAGPRAGLRRPGRAPAGGARAPPRPTPAAPIHRGRARVRSQRASAANGTSASLACAAWTRPTWPRSTSAASGVTCRRRRRPRGRSSHRQPAARDGRDRRLAADQQRLLGHQRAIEGGGDRRRSRRRAAWLARIASASATVSGKGRGRARGRAPCGSARTRRAPLRARPAAGAGA